MFVMGFGSLFVWLFALTSWEVYGWRDLVSRVYGHVFLLYIYICLDAGGEFTIPAALMSLDQVVLCGPFHISCIYHQLLYSSHIPIKNIFLSDLPSTIPLAKHCTKQHNTLPILGE